MEDDDLPPADSSDRWLHLEYDFLKQLTSLSLLAIGGVVTFAGSLFQNVADKRILWLSLAIFASGGATALTGQQRLIKAVRAGRRPGRAVVLLRELAASLFGIGAGVLIAFAYRALG